MRQALAAARALGRSGHVVAVAETEEECDEQFRVPAFNSRWSEWHSVLPEFREKPEVYAQTLLDLVRDRPTKVVIPSSDGSIDALRPWRSQFEKLGVALPLASESALDMANDKVRTLEIASMLGIDVPRSLPIMRPVDVPDVLAEIGYPVVLKPTQSWIRNLGTATRVRSKEVLDQEEGVRFVTELEQLGGKAIAQQWIGGSRESVGLFYSQGRVIAEFAQVAHRMAPVLGGVSVVRESIPMPADLRSAAEELVRALDLEGYCEVEFRRDLEGRPFLMEINARLSGSIEVAIRSGVDFPTLLWRWAQDEKLPKSHGYRTGVRMRWLHGDIQWLMENMLEGGRPDSVAPLQASMMFAKEFLRGDSNT